MIILFTLLAVAFGIAIARKNPPSSKTQKVLIAVLLPLIIGIFINALVATIKIGPYSNYWYNYGRLFPFIAIPSLAMTITLLVKLKVEKDQKSEGSPNTLGVKDEDKICQLHYGTGVDKVVFEVQLSDRELAKMNELRKQDPNKWMDNDYELVKEVKRQLETEDAEKVSDSESVASNNSSIQSETTPEQKTLELKQNGIVVSMALSQEILEQMSVIRQQNPQKWIDNEVELVKAAKRKLQGIEEVEEVTTSNNESNQGNEEIIVVEEPSSVTASSTGVFGGKLESEYRRETKVDSHWIRQDDTEICINIEEATYQKMVELQSENPKKWVNKELDLYQKAKKALLEPKSKQRKLF